MKRVSVEQLGQDPGGLIEMAQQERVVILRDGLPVAVIFGIENKDEEDWDLQLSPEFWRMIEERRGSPTVPLSEIKEELFASDRVATGADTKA